MADFEEIDSEFVRCKYGELEVIIMKKNGYINATKMCDYICEKTGSMKPFRNWIQNQYAKELVDASSISLGICKKDLFIKKQGGDVRNSKVNTFGTYVHPMLITHIVYWISPTFAVKVSEIVELWKCTSKTNENAYWNAIANAKPYSSDLMEQKIRDELCVKLNGKKEVKTDVGYVDILTDDTIIEIKHISNWKHALGQVLAYSHELPTYKKKIYLFGENNKVSIDAVKNVLDEYDIELEKIEN